MRSVLHLALAASGLGWTALRNNCYTDFLVPKLAQAIAQGQLVAAARNSGAAYVTREDCARAAAAALASTETRSEAIEITGPAVVTYAELARMASELAGRLVTYVPVAPPELRARMVAAGLPELMADALVSFDVGMSQGKLGPATSAVAELTGQAPTSVAAYLAAHREALAQRDLQPV